MVAKVSDFELSKMGTTNTSKMHISTVMKALLQTVETRQISLAEWAKSYHGDMTLDQIFDPNVKGKIEVKCLNKFVEIAISCLHDKGIERLLMNDVVRELEFALQLHHKSIGSKGDNEVAFINDNGDKPVVPSKVVLRMNPNNIYL
ncbi:hypothetical protein DVH24_038437 [Malus domestica]|uniref:Uncharacterized protein n=1 Tax=Malus domestica TaxID=3750 RepID=A0A498KFC6_MALDO|nr:hypothetical protein DVH24_038437 [Malus domestica]